MSQLKIFCDYCNKDLKECYCVNKEGVNNVEVKVLFIHLFSAVDEIYNKIKELEARYEVLRQISEKKEELEPK